MTQPNKSWIFAKLFTSTSWSWLRQNVTLTFIQHLIQSHCEFRSQDNSLCDHFGSYLFSANSGLTKQRCTLWLKHMHLRTFLFNHLLPSMLSIIVFTIIPLCVNLMIFGIIWVAKHKGQPEISIEGSQINFGGYNDWGMMAMCMVQESCFTSHLHCIVPHTFPKMARAEGRIT